MTAQDVQLSSNHQIIADRLLAACRADDRIVAAFLIGSNAKGKADEHSDLDTYIVIKDDAFDNFDATRESFVRLLGEPAFIEDFGIPNILFLIFPDGSEVELYYARASDLDQIFDSQYKVLLDKKAIASQIALRPRQVDQTGQKEKLRHLIQTFWHDCSHFATAMARNQLWWAHGQLDVLRAICVGLARLKNDFSDPDVEEEVYFKIENVMPVEQLAPLKDTFCPLDKDAMLRAGFVIVDLYRELATPLAQAYGITYPVALEKVMVERLRKIRDNA